MFVVKIMMYGLLGIVLNMIGISIIDNPASWVMIVLIVSVIDVLSAFDSNKG